jgi:hypothetical protein
VPGDERIKSRGKRRQFDSVTDMGKEKSNSLGFIDKLMRVGLGLIDLGLGCETGSGFGNPGPILP